MVELHGKLFACEKVEGGVNLVLCTCKLFYSYEDLEELEMKVYL